MEAPMMTRLTGAVLLSLILMISGCEKSSKNTASPTSAKDASQAVQNIQPSTSLTEQIDRLNADLTVLRDKVDLISNDYTKLKTSPALELTDQVKKLDTDLSKLKENVDSTSNKVDSISAKVESITKDINSISAKVDSISKDYTKVAYRVTALEPGSALLSTENEGYAVANTKFGPFIVTKRGMSQYNDGYKVKLGIGNFTNAAFKGARLSINWGALSGQDKNTVKWVNERSKKFEILDELSSGAYTNVEIPLAPARAEELEIIQVGIELTQVYLKTK
jgi:uncharacterized phage infection (PIP) family protein YhgE